MQKLKNIVIAVVMMLSFAPAVLPASTLAASASKNSACTALKQLDDSQGCATDASRKVVPSLVSTIVKILSVILGAIAVVMIIVSGFRYVTSGGDTNKVASAKNTLVYAIIGLLVALLAQFIVQFVLKSFK